MALVRERRQVNLRLPLPETTNRHQSYPLPLPPSITTTTTATTSTTATFSVSDFTKLSMLGRGNGGTVYKVSHKQTGAIYALKIINSNSINHLQIHREREILRRTGADSPYVVKCYGVMDLTDGDVGIIMEYMDKGTLECTLKNKGTFNECMISHVATRVLNGLKFLHSKKIVHRDIKPANILVDSSWNVKIADFGVGRIMGRTLDPCNSYVGTCAYMSPERFDPDTYGGNYNGYAADIWSLGLTLMELYLGYFPFLKPGQRPDWATLMCAICFGDPPALPNGSGSIEFRNFIECCLQKEASKRWSASQLLNHPFLLKCKKNDVKW